MSPSNAEVDERARTSIPVAESTVEGQEYLDGVLAYHAVSGLPHTMQARAQLY